MRSRLRLTFTALLLASVSTTVQAELWPWSSSSKAKPVTQTVPSQKSTSTPLLNGKPIFTSADKPQSWSAKMSDLSKKTVDVVTLKPLRDKWSAPQRSTSTSKPPVVTKKADSSGSWIANLFKPKPEEKKIKTVGDWLSQPRPQ